MITEIGPHSVRHGNILDPDFSALMGNEKASLFLSDPPWGQGNLNYWQTINTRQTGAEPIKIEYQVFIRRIFTIAQQHCNTTALVFIGYGQRWRQDIVSIASEYGLFPIGLTETLYTSGSKKLPLDFHVFAFTPGRRLPMGYLDGIYHTVNYATLKAAIPPFARPGDILLDPCCGLGYAARIAVECGMRFRGNEINYHRLDSTKKILYDSNKTLTI